MSYSQQVVDHYENPRNVGKLDKNDPSVGTGLVGAPACGDVLQLQIKVDDGVITDAKFKTYGCGSAIASSSLVTTQLRIPILRKNSRYLLSKYTVPYWRKMQLKQH
jgi:nitrogen fixation NifU-like protein